MSFEKNILESQVFLSHLDRIIIRVGSVWAAEVGVAVCCQRFSHSNTHIRDGYTSRTTKIFGFPIFSFLPALAG